VIGGLVGGGISAMRLLAFNDSSTLTSSFSRNLNSLPRTGSTTV